MIRTIAIVENQRIPGVAEAREEVVRLCRERGLTVQKQVGPDTDLVITLGGDGTLLRAAAMVRNGTTLLYGIKHGKVGFLTNTVADLPAAVGRLAAGEFHVSPRLALGVTVGGKTERCLNEVVIERASSRIVTFTVADGGRPLLAQRADGIIIATPTGSTAHLLAAGGPVIAPEMEALAVLALAPHTLAARPVLLPGSARLTVAVDAPCTVVCDGQREWRISAGETVAVAAHPAKLNLVLDEDHGFFQKLSEKFCWGL